MQEIAILKCAEVNSDRGANDLICLNKLKNIMADDPVLLRDLVNKAIESLEESKSEVLQASVEKNTTQLRSCIHKVTPLFNYLDAEPTFDIIKTCTKTILCCNLLVEANIAYQVILKNLDKVLNELTEKSKYL